jgi:ABC-type uncharacterized transport system substrate-binding protein
MTRPPAGTSTANTHPVGKGVMTGNPFRKKLVRLAVSIIFCLLAAGPAGAHPHVFVDYDLTFVLDEQGLTGIEITWLFDEMFSQALLEEGDLDHDRHFDRREIALVKKGAFDNLAKYGYFTRLCIDGQTRSVDQVMNFRAGMQDERAWYRFFVPCPITASSAWRTVAVTLFDPTIYTDLSLAERGIHHRDVSRSFQIRHDVTLAQEAGFPDAPLLPDGIIFTFRLP